MTVCQPSGAIRAAIDSSSPVRQRVHEALDEVEAHAPDAGRVQRVQLLVGHVAPAHRRDAPAGPLPSECSNASVSARLSAPWQVACTITLRENPSRSRSAHS